MMQEEQTMMNPNVGLGTKAIHAGNVKDAQYGCLLYTSDAADE